MVTSRKTLSEDTRNFEKYRAMTYTIISFLLFIFLGAILHELGHFLIIVLSGSKINYVNIDFQNQSFNINYTTNSVLVDVINGYFGGLFSALAMTMAYLRYRKFFQLNSKAKTRGIGLAYFGVVGINLVQGIAEGAFRSIYLNNMVFTGACIVIGAVVGIQIFRALGPVKRRQ